MSFFKINKIVLRIFLLIFLSNYSFAQKYGDKDYFLIDSLNLENLSQDDLSVLHEALNIYHNSKDDTVKLRALEMISENLMHDVWIDYNLLVKNFAEKKLTENPNFQLKKKYLKSLAGSINNIGVNCEQQGNLVDAILYFHKCLKIQEYLKDKDGAATTLNNIGVIYNSLENIEKSIDYFQKSLNLREEISDKKGIAQSLNNLGSIYYEQKDYSKALSNFEKSYTLYQDIGDKEGMAYSLSNTGNIYDLLKSNRGLSFHKRSLKIREEIGDKKGVAFELANISESYIVLKNMNEAFIYATQAYELSKSNGYPENIQKSAIILSRIYKQKSDFSSALKFYEISVQMKDSIRNDDTNKASYKLQSKYEFEKQQAVKDAEHNKQMEVVDEREKKQKVIIYSIALGSILLLVFFIFVLNRLQVTKKQKSIIEEQKKLVDVKQKEILDSINYAKRIQAAILPSERIIKEHLPNSFIYYQPKDIVAGDFYWIESVKSEEYRVMSDEPQTPHYEYSKLNPYHPKLILFAAADCTGHGVPGAMVSVVCNNALNRSVREFNLKHPGEILDKTKEIVIQEFEKSESDVKDGMDISLCSLEFGEGNLNSEYPTRIRWSGANNPLWLIRNNQLIEIKPTKQSISKTDVSVNFETHQMNLLKNDTIYVFTDGYVDQFGGEKGKKFKATRLKELLLSIQEMDMNTQFEMINKTFENWKGELEQVDDVCIIGVRI